MKRKHSELSAAEKDNLYECLCVGGGSDAHAVKVWNIAASLREDGKAISSTSASRLRSRKLQSPRSCFKQHALRGEGEAELPVLIADLPLLLQYAADNSRQWSEALRACVGGATGARAVLYHDECTCGNILAPRKSKKKITLVYLSFAELLPPMMHREDGWLTIAMMQHSELELISAGMNHFMTAIIQTLHGREATGGSSCE